MFHVTTGRLERRKSERGDGGERGEREEEGDGKVNQEDW